MEMTVDTAKVLLIKIKIDSSVVYVKL